MCSTQPMRAEWYVSAGAILVVCAAVAGCGSPPSSRVSSPVPDKLRQASVPAVASYQSPEQATLSWFSAINHKDKAAAIAHFAAAAADQMNWGNGDTSTWPTFSSLHCRQVSRSATAASVNCTFSESQAESVGNPDSFWTVDLKRQPDNRWLITNYGQG